MTVALCGVSTPREVSQSSVGDAETAKRVLPGEISQPCAVDKIAKSTRTGEKTIRSCSRESTDSSNVPAVTSLQLRDHQLSLAMAKEKRCRANNWGLKGCALSGRYQATRNASVDNRAVSPAFSLPLAQ